jgi:hypothetical protein
MRYLLVVIVVLFVGCSGPKKPLYIWNNYSELSMIYGTNEGNSEILNRYIKELKFIIDESEDRKKRVAPNLYSEYGYLLYTSGKKQEALDYFEKEAKIYPESKKFMKQLIKKLYKKGDK